MQPDAPREADKPFPALLRELGDEIGTLVRQEIALAKVELTEKLKPAEAAAGMFSGTLVLALGAFGALTTFLIAGIAALGLQVWLVGADRDDRVRHRRARARADRQEEDERSDPARSRANRADRKGGHRMGKDSSEIRREIEETRARMGDTVEALSYKADVPAQIA